MITNSPVVARVFKRRLAVVGLFALSVLPGRTLLGQTNSISSGQTVPHGLIALQQHRAAVAAILTNVQPFLNKTNFALPLAARVATGRGARSTILGSGAHHRLWAVGGTNSGSARGASGATLASYGGRVMEIGSGINYWDGEKWTPSDATLEVSPEGDAFAANRLCYQVRLQADNLNTAGAITITTPDGKVLRSTPIAIALYDAASGQTMVLAGVTNCAAVLVSSNKVVYENAFNENGVQASVICTAERGSFAADIVLTSRIDPADYGFPSKTTRIQMITEYYDPPEPERIRTALRVETDPAVRQKMASPDLMDETLGFGELAFGPGFAYTTTNLDLAVAGANVPASRGGATVAKEFTTTDGRKFLIESVEYPSIQKQLQSLHQTKPKGAFLRPKRGMRKAEYAKLPSAAPRDARLAGTLAPPKAKRSRMEMASIIPIGLTGICIDPGQTIGGTITGMQVFQGDTTYFVSAPVYCNGLVTIEGGAVFKYPNSTGDFHCRR